jgi:hypothetical protein
MFKMLSEQNVSIKNIDELMMVIVEKKVNSLKQFTNKNLENDLKVKLKIGVLNFNDNSKLQINPFSIYHIFYHAYSLKFRHKINLKRKSPNSN